MSCVNKYPKIGIDTVYKKLNQGFSFFSGEVNSTTNMSKAYPTVGNKKPKTKAAMLSETIHGGTLLGRI